MAWTIIAVKSDLPQLELPAIKILDLCRSPQSSNTIQTVSYVAF